MNMVWVCRRYVEIEEEKLRDLVESMVDRTPLILDELYTIGRKIEDVAEARKNLKLAEEASILEMVGAR